MDKKIVRNGICCLLLMLLWLLKFTGDFDTTIFWWYVGGSIVTLILAFVPRSPWLYATLPFLVGYYVSLKSYDFMRSGFSAVVAVVLFKYLWKNPYRPKPPKTSKKKKSKKKENAYLQEKIQEYWIWFMQGLVLLDMIRRLIQTIAVSDKIHLWLSTMNEKAAWLLIFLVLVFLVVRSAWACAHRGRRDFGTDRQTEYLLLHSACLLYYILSFFFFFLKVSTEYVAAPWIGLVLIMVCFGNPFLVPGNVLRVQVDNENKPDELALIYGKVQEWKTRRKQN